MRSFPSRRRRTGSGRRIQPAYQEKRPVTTQADSSDFTAVSRLKAAHMNFASHQIQPGCITPPELILFQQVSHYCYLFHGCRRLIWVYQGASFRLIMKQALMLHAGYSPSEQSSADTLHYLPFLLRTSAGRAARRSAASAAPWIS